MAEWECIKVDHHDKIAKLVQSREKAGWKLHSYTAAPIDLGAINHYLLFYYEKKD